MLKIELCTSQSEGKETQLGTWVGAFLPAGSRTCTSRRGEEKGKQRRGSNIFGLFPFQAEPIPLGGIWRERKELENKTREGEKDMGGTSGMCCFPLPPGTGEPWGGEDGEMGGSSQFGTKMKGHTWSVGRLWLPKHWWLYCCVFTLEDVRARFESFRFWRLSLGRGRVTLVGHWPVNVEDEEGFSKWGQTNLLWIFQLCFEVNSVNCAKSYGGKEYCNLRKTNWEFFHSNKQDLWRWCFLLLKIGKNILNWGIWV